MDEDEAWKGVGRIAAARRKQIGLTQEQVAEYGGPGKTTVGKVENGRMRPFPTETQQQLERVLGYQFGRLQELHALILEFGAEVIEQELGELEGPDAVMRDAPDLTALRRSASRDAAMDEVADTDDVALVAALSARLARASAMEEEARRLRRELDLSNRRISELERQEQTHAEGTAKTQAPGSGAVVTPIDQVEPVELDEDRPIAAHPRKGRDSVGRRMRDELDELGEENQDQDLGEDP